MKKFLFGCAIAVGGFAVSTASADDYCCPMQYDPCCDEPGFNGVFFGGNVGVISHMAHRNDLDGFLTDNSKWTTNDTDVTAGVQLGYDWQCCNAVIGIVGDWNWTNVEHKLREDPNNPDNNAFIKSRFEWFSTFRARLGMGVCDTFFYLTAGAAAARFETTWKDAPLEFKHHDTRWGWTGGVGVEFLAWCNWSIGAEILFLHFHERSKSFTDEVGGSTYSFSHSDSAWVGRILLNYRLGDCCCLFN